MSEDAGLESWRDTATRRVIIDFVERATGSGPESIPKEQRIAVFDNDGTLWTEKPMPTQLHFIVLQWAAAVRADPSLADTQPYRAAASQDFGWLGTAIDKHYAGDDSDLKTIIGALLKLTADMSVEDYEEAVSAFYRDAQHLTLGRPYSSVVYQPMIELLRYLEANGFTCYIVSGGDRDFMRPMTIANYGIPPERVVGSAVGLSYARWRRSIQLDVLVHGRRPREAGADLEPDRATPGAGRRKLERRRADAGVRAEASAEPEPADPP